MDLDPEIQPAFFDSAQAVTLKGKHVSSNIDFYSGFVYEMLNIPLELASPLFVCARIVGWLAHNIEDKCYCNRIIRPATKYVGDYKE